MSDAPELQLMPAVDVAGGRAVGLVQAEESSERTYGDPVEVARDRERSGAPWIHLVDIDAAFGRGDNRAVLTDVVEAVEIPVQVSGGVRDESSLARALSTGCARVNLATESLTDWAWVESAIGAQGDRVGVCLDVKGLRLAPRGRDEDELAGEAADLWQAVARLDRLGCARYIVTDVTRDGAMAGPNIDLLSEVCARTSRPVIASGGVSSLADISALRSLVPDGLEGTIVGKALYAGAFTLADAVDVARR